MAYRNSAAPDLNFIVMEVQVVIKEVTGNGAKVLHRQTCKSDDLFNRSMSDFVTSCKVLFPKANFVEFNCYCR